MFANANTSNLLWLLSLTLNPTVLVALLITFTSTSYFLAARENNTNPRNTVQSFDQCLTDHPSLTTLQKHILFWDKDGDNILWPHDVYNGFRDIGFSIPFALTSLLIPIFFSYPTHLAHSYLPDPFFRIHLDSIHQARHGSDTGIYDQEGNFRESMFEEIFSKFDSRGDGSLNARNLLDLVSRNRVAADPAGWTFAAMEWGTTWLLLQKDGKVCKEDLKACYDGTLFSMLSEHRKKGTAREKGYGWKGFWNDPLYILRELQRQ